MATEQNLVPDADQIAEAQWRFGLIAPVIQDTFTEKSASAYYQRVTENSLIKPGGIVAKLKPGTLEKWTSAYRRGGFDALLPKHRIDRGSTRALSSEAKAEIVRLIEKFPRLKGQQIWECLREHALIDQSVSVRSVQRYIRANDLRNPAITETKVRMAFEEAEFGMMWQADTCYFPKITEDGKTRKTYCICIIDDHSRVVVGSEIFYEDNAANFQKVLKDAIATYGIPRKLLLDNGSPYANEQLSLICGTLGVVIIHCAPRDGAAKGKQERYWRRAKDQKLYGMDMAEVTSLRQFNTEYAGFVHKYNHSFHEGINERPYDRFERTGDHMRRPESDEWLNTAFLNRITRKVRNDSTVTIQNVLYDVPQQFIRTKVEIRYMPNDMSTACIFFDGKKYPIRKTNKVENCHTRRKNLKYTLDYSKVGD